MSEIVHYRGKIIEIATGTKEIEEKSKSILKENNKMELPHYYISWVEYLEDLYYDDYIRINDRLYAIEKSTLDLGDIFVATKTDKGYNFEVQYHNGGMGLDEALRESVDGIKE